MVKSLSFIKKIVDIPTCTLYNVCMTQRGFSMENIIDNELATPDFDEWLMVGISNGWVTEPFCYTHDGDPYMTEEEEKEWEDGGDPCAPVIKLINQ
jgi:hypothetical protein